MARQDSRDNVAAARREKESLMEVYVSQCDVRNPFQSLHLPLAAKAYRYRKGAFRRRSLLQKTLRLLTPSNLFLKGLLALAGQSTRGTFSYRREEAELPISFRVANTQFHALYFPQYESGYEPETTCLFDKILADNPRSVFLDVGANWGFFSLFVASSPGFEGSVHAFEPFPATFADLTDVVRQAKLNDVVHCHELALADENRGGFMRSHDGVTSGTASVTSSGTGTSMRLAMLDSLNCPAPDLIKVDVEGFEAAVFQGAVETISATRPMIVFETWLHADRPAETLKPFRILQSLGYRFFEPAQLCGDDDSRHLVGFCKSGLPDSRRGLGLAEFLPEQRSLLQQHFNVFACHESRCEAFLETHFERLSGKSPRPSLRLAPESLRRTG